MGKKMTSLIYDDSVLGHHMEYIHHIYMIAIQNSQKDYYFCVPSEFKKNQSKFEWPAADNVGFHFFESKSKKGIGPIKKMRNILHKCWTIRKLVKLYDANNVFLIHLELLMPFLSIFIPRKCLISGIVYQVYLFDWKNLSLGKKLYRILRYYPYKFSKKFASIFILNSCVSAVVLNKKWNTNVFKYVPDPIAVDSSEIVVDSKNCFQPIEGEHILLQFGGMRERKGTLDILDAALLLGDQEKRKYHFVFAGMIMESMHDAFYEKVAAAIKENVKITVFDEFCSYRFITHLVAICDCILVPYYNTNQSSGLVGYSVVARKKVMLPQKGMLKKLGLECGTGLLIANNSPQSICDGISKIENADVNEKKRIQYLESHSVENFGRIIVSNL